MTEGERLILGGHSFIAPLGNDPEASFDEQCAIVAAFLDGGARWIDTTYYQERVALGRVLRHLGRRDEARVLAWNFFRQPGRENDLVGPAPYQPDHLAVLLAELQTDNLDLLVVHAHDDAAGLNQELALAAAWQAAGVVRNVGLGMAEARHLDRLPDGHPVTHVLAPFNAFNPAAASTFEKTKAANLTTVAMSPFVRGWKMDEIVRATGADNADVADLLLRWAAFAPFVDYVDVSIRNAAWVETNLRSLGRGPLNNDERARLNGWLARQPPSSG